MRVRGYSEDEAVNRTLQTQVRQEFKKLKGIASASASAVLSAAAAMVALSTTVMTTALATISPEDNDGLPVLSLPSPPKKTRKTSHQRQVGHQNEWKAKEAYVQALDVVSTGRRSLVAGAGRGWIRGSPSSPPPPWGGRGGRGWGGGGDGAARDAVVGTYVPTTWCQHWPTPLIFLLRSLS